MVAERRAGLPSRKQRRNESATAPSRHSIAETIPSKKFKALSLGDDDDTDQLGDRSDQTEDEIEELEDQMDKISKPEPRIPGQRLHPLRHPEFKQWEKGDLLKIAKLARNAELHLGMETRLHRKRYPGEQNREDVWSNVPEVLRTLLEICELKDRILDNEEKRLGSLVLTRNLIAGGLGYEPYDVSWEQRVEQAFDAFKTNRTHISLPKAQEALMSRTLDTPIPSDTFDRMARIDKDIFSLREKHAMDTSDNALTKRSGWALFLSFRAFRVLAGLARHSAGLLKLPSDDEVKIHKKKEKLREAKRKARMEALRLKYQPKCDWSHERRVNERRRKQNLEDFFLKNGMSKAACKKVLRESGRIRERKLNWWLQEIARYQNLTMGYEITFYRHFNRPQKRNEPQFQAALKKELEWFVEQGYVELTAKGSSTIREFKEAMARIDSSRTREREIGIMESLEHAPAEFYESVNNTTAKRREVLQELEELIALEDDCDAS